MSQRYAVYDTLAGDVTILAGEKALTRMLFGIVDPPDATNEENTLLYDAIMELNQYFFGQRHRFDLRLAPEGTPFEKKVWDYVQTIPYGTTASYEEVAEAIGEAGAARAVGNALMRNPIPIFIPCHRVIEKSGQLGGYIGGEELKEKLLKLEAHNAPRFYGEEGVAVRKFAV